jgi:hypothetical protein
MSTSNPEQIPLFCTICETPLTRFDINMHALTCSKPCLRERGRRMKAGDQSAKCIVCKKPCAKITKALPVCREHRTALARARRVCMLMRKCFQCKRPSTPIERAAYRRFRSAELTRPDLLYPGAFKRWQQDTGEDVAAFSIALQESLLAKEERGDNSPGVFDLELVDRRRANIPGGARSGRKQIEWMGGNPNCKHALKRTGPGRKDPTPNEQNKCNKCDARRELGNS